MKAAERIVALCKRRPMWAAAAVFILLSTLYWGLLADRRYVSEAHVLVENVQTPGPSLELSSLFGGSPASKDILMLRDHLLSADMLLALDRKLRLREHYSSSYDVFSRMLYRDEPLEWFLRHYQSRVEVLYDDYTGVLLIRAQAYSPQMAHAIASAMLQEGERFMNELGHKLAREQVAFAEQEVRSSSERLARARQALLAYQNRYGLVSPTAMVESISAVAARLESELSSLQARRTAAATYLAPTAPELVTLNSQIGALEQQVKKERARVASPAKGGEALNRVAEEYERMLLEAGFEQDLYRTALAALERARMDASRMLKKISVLQVPTLPEYSLEPARLYTITLFILGTLILAGLAQLVLTIIREHRD
jgi:capsular polysaccharide transport system permease protein